MSYEQARALMDRGVSRPTLFALTLPNLVNRRTNDYLNLFCRATAIPEIRTATAFVNGHERMGISREQPTAIRFGKPFRIEVIENSEFSVYQDLRQWFDMTCVDINDPRASQRMNYYESYVQDMQLHKLELPDNLLGALGSAELTANYKRVMTINFVNAYPIKIGAISLNTESRNTVTTYSVDFTYESYSIGDTTGVGGQLF